MSFDEDENHAIRFYRKLVEVVKTFKHHFDANNTMVGSSPSPPTESPGCGRSMYSQSGIPFKVARGYPADKSERRSPIINGVN